MRKGKTRSVGIDTGSIVLLHIVRYQVSGIFCIIAFETAMRLQNFAKQKLNRER